MTLPRLAAMSAGWKDVPPLNVSVARLLRALVGKPSSSLPAANQENDNLFKAVEAAEEFEA